MGTTAQKPIAILGAGSWGTALALYLARLGQDVKLITQDEARAKVMQTTRVNERYLPEHTFPNNLQVTSDLKITFSNVEMILIAVPSVVFRETLQTLKPVIAATTPIVWATKGLEPGTAELLHEIAQHTLGTTRAYAILSGPSFAKEVAAGLPTAVVVASQNQVFAQQVLQRFNSQLFRIYLSADVIGVEISGVVKNVLAIAAGICDGMQLGSNARSALITRGLAEMIRLGIALGGQYETFTGLAGMGDLVLTCTDNQSRNHRFGFALGQGKSITAAEQQINQVIEGKRNAELVALLAKKHGIDMPISTTVWQILNGQTTPQAALQNLLSRAPKAE